MKSIVEPARQLPVVADVDVAVAGGGPGGFPAAISAARHGMRVLLIERYGFLGGLATAGLVAPILGHTAHNSDRPIVEGILKEVTERMHRLKGAPPWQETLKEWGIRFEPQALKRVADEMVEEADVQLLLHSLVVGAITEGNRIKAVIAENKSGRQAILARVFIDATGDADLAFHAGASLKKGRDFDGRVQAMGFFVHIDGVKELSSEDKNLAMEKVLKAIEAGRFSFFSAGIFAKTSLPRHHSSCNLGRLGGDPTDVSDLTKAELQMRRDVWELIGFLRAEVKGFEDCYLRDLSIQVCPRESRQVIGNYVLTGDDIRQGKKFEDAVARGSWWIDIHCPQGEPHPVHLCVKECPKKNECAFWSAEHERSMLSRDEIYPPDGDWYDIPYRSLLSRDITNLLVSGRCISATHEAMAGTRVMGTCVAIGQAVGTASALAIEKGVPPAKVTADELRETLRNDGALV